MNSIGRLSTSIKRRLDEQRGANKPLNQEVDQLKKRIRELEEQLKDAGWRDHQRISKAKAILESAGKWENIKTGLWTTIQEALEALESLSGNPES